MCRDESYFVIPSEVYLTGDRKASLTAHYLSHKEKKPCMHFNQGRGECPFGSSCHYSHELPEGMQLLESGESGVTVVRESYTLADHIFKEAR
jgi:hypothetical protein